MLCFTNLRFFCDRHPKEALNSLAPWKREKSILDVSDSFESRYHIIWQTSFCFYDGFLQCTHEHFSRGPLYRCNLPYQVHLDSLQQILLLYAHLISWVFSATSPRASLFHWQSNWSGLWHSYGFPSLPSVVCMGSISLHIMAVHTHSPLPQSAMMVADESVCVCMCVCGSVRLLMTHVIASRLPV